MTKHAQAEQFLAKYREYTAKARAAPFPKTRAAFQAIARECLHRAAECDPGYVDEQSATAN